MIIAVLIAAILYMGWLIHSGNDAHAGAKKRIAVLEMEISRLAETQKRNLQLEAELKRVGPVIDLDKSIQEREVELLTRKSDLEKVSSAIQESAETLSEYELRQDLEETSFYHPRYEFEDIAQYSEALELVNEAQKELIKRRQAFYGPDRSELKGDYRKIGNLALAAFNSESEVIIEGVSFDNFEQSKEKLRILFNKINNLAGPSDVLLADEYLDLKVKEMAIAYDYREAAQKAKDEQLELKSQMREEEQARDEAEKAREEAMEEQARYEAALAAARKEMESRSEGERAEYEKKILALQQKLDEATAERERATAMAQITKKGHVYIISNLGSFGEDVFKIGMTRRKDPQERIKELGDASVPFGFDVHAVIYAEDAPALENLLHKQFDHGRMNKVNLRKEFFRVSLDAIAQTCEKMGHKVQLTKQAEAREYRATLLMAQKVVAS